MSWTSWPARIDESVLEVLLDFLDTLAQGILTGEDFPHVSRKAPNDRDILFAQRSPDVVSQETHCLIKCGIAGCAEVLTSPGIDEIELGLYTLHQGAYLRKIRVGEFWDTRNVRRLLPLRTRDHLLAISVGCLQPFSADSGILRCGRLQGFLPSEVAGEYRIWSAD